MENIKEMLKNIQENITPRKLLIGSLIFCAFISLVGVTWAWFSPIDTGDNNVVEVEATTASLSITYDGGNEFRVENILPGWSGTKTFSVTNTGDAPAQYDINWSTLVNTFSAKGDFVYSITSTDKGGTLTETAVPGSVGTIIADNIIGVGKTQTYTITFKYINRNSTQNDQGKKISGKIVINEDNESFDTFYIQEDSTQSTKTTKNAKVTKVADETLTYYTKDSMTWETWVATGLNYDDFIVDGNNIKNAGGYLVKDGSGNSILKTATISAETSYKMKSAKKTLAESILANNPPTTAATNPGSAIATTDEGLISGEEDDDGDVYYFRGNVQDNYVSFAGKTWRVMRINGDGTVRMILDGTTGTDAVWNNETDSTYNNKSQTDSHDTMVSWLTYSNSPLKTNIETWYSNNIGNNSNYSDKVATTKYCSDLTHTGTSTGTTIGAGNRMSSPTFKCPSSYTYNLNVATLNSDEIFFAGAKSGSNNNSYYLYTGSMYWTMSPCYWGRSAYVNVFHVSSNGTLYDCYVGFSDGVRPVINLKPTVKISNTSMENIGTSTNPYVIS